MYTWLYTYQLNELTRPSPSLLHDPTSQVRSVFIGLAMMGFLHVYMNYTQPLFIQGLMGLKNVYDAKPVQIYIFGKPAEGDLKRPFKASGGMFGGAFSLSLTFLPSLVANSFLIYAYVMQVLLVSPRRTRRLSMRQRRRLARRRMSDRTTIPSGFISYYLRYVLPEISVSCLS